MTVIELIAQLEEMDYTVKVYIDISGHMISLDHITGEITGVLDHLTEPDRTICREAMK